MKGLLCRNCFCFPVQNQSGEIIATTGHEENVIVAEIDYSKIKLQRLVYIFAIYSETLNSDPTLVF